MAQVEAVETTGKIVEVTPQKDADVNLSLEQEAMISELVDSAKKGDDGAKATCLSANKEACSPLNTTCGSCMVGFKPDGDN